jgi:hypothetical protein
MPGSNLAEQERDAIELFGRADRRTPDTNSVVRTPSPLTRLRPPADCSVSEKTCTESRDKARPFSPYVAQTHGCCQHRQVFQGVP